MASKPEVLKDIEETLGFVPEWLEVVPDESIESEWSQIKNWDMAETAIPSKYKSLIGLAVAATLQCDYSVLYHTAGARSHGASDVEIEEACRMAKATGGWSNYLKGLQVDLKRFRQDVQRVSEHMRTQKAA